MKKRLTGLAIMAALLGCMASGCAWSVGGKNDVHRSPTRGQELMDLKKAREQGAITEDEYVAAKKRIIEK